MSEIAASPRFKRLGSDPPYWSLAAKNASVFVAAGCLEDGGKTPKNLSFVIAE